MSGHICAYCVHAKPASAPGKLWCQNLSRTVDKTSGESCPYFR